MSRPRVPQPGKLVIGLFMREKTFIGSVARLLSERFGPIDMVSPWWVFDHTAYYESEMGAPLYRRLLVFQRLMAQGVLAPVKLVTNKMERITAHEGRRRVNIDPGCLMPERFVLASGKNYAHRIYLAHGIYADLTLIYQQGEFKPLAWTYPDYAGSLLRSYLAKVRRKYLHDLRWLRPRAG
jgi:hypothetical protein